MIPNATRSTAVSYESFEVSSPLAAPSSSVSLLLHPPCHPQSRPLRPHLQACSLTFREVQHLSTLDRVFREKRRASWEGDVVRLAGGKKGGLREVDEVVMYRKFVSRGLVLRERGAR